MTLLEMLQYHLKSELIIEGFVSERKLKLMSNQLKIEPYQLEVFISDAYDVVNVGVVHCEFINLLFERYRDKIINPLRSVKKEKDVVRIEE